ncbi:MAG: hypothetical protein IJI35_02945, partial [Kiritimatiellae bacterium]|nr:hypothetical protein [Kiritimatiellia bacterium]
MIASFIFWFVLTSKSVHFLLPKVNAISSSLPIESVTAVAHLSCPQPQINLPTTGMRRSRIATTDEQAND